VNKNIFLKKIKKNLNSESFFISDDDNKYTGKQILKQIDIKLKKIKKNNNVGSTIAIIKNCKTAEYWVNFLVAMMNDFTIYPEIKETNITKYYSNVTIFNGKNIEFYKNNSIKNSKNIRKFDLIFSSSGSTGEPKLILQSLKSVLINSSFVQKEIKFKKNKNFMMCMPSPFTSAICHFLLCLYNGVSIYTYQRVLFPKNLNKIIVKNKINYFGGPPLHSKWIVEDGKKENLEKLISSGDYLSEEVINKYLNKNLNFDFYYMYGLSEVGGRCCINLIKNNKYKSYVGKPLKYLKLKSKNNIEKEIIITSKYLFKGYYLNNKFYFRKGIDFKTGDIGKVKNNYLKLSGRASEIFKSSGIMVYPLMICKIMMKSKWFKNVFVFKGFIKNFGYVPFCAFVPKTKISKNKIYEYLSNKLSSNQIPKKFKSFKSFPRLGNNKIDKISIINNF